MTLADLERKLRQALKLDVPYPERAPQSGGRPAAVLILFADDAQGPAVLLTRRAEKVETHKGQMAFPGGQHEPHEVGAVDGHSVAALREAEEEVGVPPSAVRILGELPSLWTVTGFWVTPVVGLLDRPASEFTLKLNEHEIAEAAWIPLAVLRRDGVYRREFFQAGSVNWPIHVYQVGDYRIWGATGSMIKNLLDRLAAVG